MKKAIVLLILLSTISISQAQEIANTDLQTFRSGSLSAAGMSAYNLRKHYVAEGPGVLKPAVPVLAERIIREIKALEPPDVYLGEEGECLGDLIWLLSRSEDIRAKEALIAVMLSKKVGGSMVGEGLHRIGPAVLPDVMKYLGSDTEHEIRSAVSTLLTIAENDSARTFFSTKDREAVRSRILSKITTDDDPLRTLCIRALGLFGDTDDIPLLETIAREDKRQTKTGIYVDRRMAKEAVEKLKKQVE